MKKNLLFFLGFAAIFSIVFKSLVLNPSLNLIDWRDYSYVAWVINQNIIHLKSLDIAHLFNLNAFYPYTSTLFLSDTLIAQALLGIPFSIFTNNPVLIFNLIFFTTFILNYLAAYALFNSFFKNKLVAFVGSVATIFSPFFYTQLGHFQMQSYWPFLFVILFLFKEERKKSFKNEVAIGFFLALQFLASVYLAFFTLALLAIFYTIKLLKGADLKTIATKIGTVLIVFLLLDAIFIKGYLDARKQFSVNRPLGEFLVYSAKITDYIFPRQNGIFYSNGIITKWKSLNNHNYGETASFPGLILGSLALLALIRIKKDKKSFSLNFSTETKELLFLLTTAIGFLFSLGYPYLPFVKYLPLFDTIRGTSRWSFLFYVGIVYFAILFISRVKAKWLLIALSLLLLLDVIPAHISTSQEEYISGNDQILKSLCESGNKIVLEIPVTHFDAGDNIAVGLSYITKRLLATSYNHCTLVNGYSGYDLPSIQKIKDNLIASNEQGKSDIFYKTIKDTGADYISVNTNVAPQILYPNLSQVLARLAKLGKIKALGQNVYQIE